MPQKDGNTLREHLQQVKKQGIEPRELNIQCPDGYGYIWEWFCEIRLFSDDDLTWETIKAWSDITGNRPNAAEMDIIKSTNQALIEVRHKWLKQRS